MEATAIVPVKRFGAAKSRLADALSPEGRAALAEAMLADVLAALRSASRVERTLVVTGEPAAERAARAAGAEVLADREDSGHSHAAALGVREAVASAAECAALLPGDCPLLRAGELDAALAELGSGAAVIVPDRHGSGTNALLLSPPGAIAPSFGPGSRERHLALAGRAGVAARVAEIPSLALDLDTPDDLRALTERLAREPSLAPRTAAALASLPAACS